MRFRAILIISLFLAGFCQAQIPKEVDSATQTKKIHDMPTDTVAPAEKFENPAQGGENTGKQKQPAQKLNKDGKRPKGQLNNKSETPVKPGVNNTSIVAADEMFYCRKCDYKSKTPGKCPNDGMELIKAGTYYCSVDPDVFSDSPGKCPKCGRALKRMSNRGMEKKQEDNILKD